MFYPIFVLIICIINNMNIISLDQLNSTHSHLLTILKSTLSKKRYNHSEQVAFLAYDLAHRFDANQESAWLAGWAHDYCREMKNKEILDLALQSRSPTILGTMADVYLNREDFMKSQKYWGLFHGLAATTLLHKYYPLSPEVYYAIASHTLGFPSASILQKIIYVSDTLEPNRKFWSKEERAIIIESDSLDDQVSRIIEKIKEIFGSIDDITKRMLL